MFSHGCCRILGNCTFHFKAGWLCDGWFPGLFRLCFLLSLSLAHCMLLFTLQNVWHFESWDKTLKEWQSWEERNTSSRLTPSWRYELVTDSSFRHCTYITLFSTHNSVQNKCILQIRNWCSRQLNILIKVTWFLRSRVWIQDEMSLE